MIQALTSACFLSTVFYDFTGLERQNVIQTYLKPLKEYDKKPSRITNHQKRILKKKEKRKKKVK